ncbi:MAG: AI-2E family transporter [Xenococcaceae cyanobacterium MO_188.B32]|nr:AI-2E family transporter [Xenococcaceae cyanobacterium MO_188.B32]
MKKFVALFPVFLWFKARIGGRAKLAVTIITLLGIGTIWMVPATLIDNVLKPIFMASGLPVPMLVILMGVLGGTLAHGIIGLFVGPVILSLGYELIKAWINSDSIIEPISVNGV